MPEVVMFPEVAIMAEVVTLLPCVLRKVSCDTP